MALQYGTAITMMMLAPGSCTMEYKQLDMCTKITQCCSARPKLILPIPKMQALFACYRDIYVYNIKAYIWCIIELVMNISVCIKLDIG